VRKAVVRQLDGFVTNVIEIEVDSTWKAPDGHILVDDQDSGSPGDIWDGNKFNPPIERLEEKEQLRLDALNRAIEAIKDNETKLMCGRILKDITIALGWIEPE
jgi:hypothetical protein